MKAINVYVNENGKKFHFLYSATNRRACAILMPELSGSNNSGQGRLVVEEQADDAEQAEQILIRAVRNL